MRRDPVEIVLIAVPILAEVIAVILFIACIAVYAMLFSGA